MLAPCSLKANPFTRIYLSIRSKAALTERLVLNALIMEFRRELPF